MNDQNSCAPTTEPELFQNPGLSFLQGNSSLCKWRCLLPLTKTFMLTFPPLILLPSWCVVFIKSWNNHIFSLTAKESQSGRSRLSRALDWKNFHFFFLTLTYGFESLGFKSTALIAYADQDCKVKASGKLFTVFLRAVHQDKKMDFCQLRCKMMNAVVLERAPVWNE